MIPTLSFGASRSIARERSSGVPIRFAPTFVITLPAEMPALASGEFGSTLITASPAVPKSPKPFMSVGRTLTPSIAVGPTCTVAVVLPVWICFAIERARAIGIAKAWALTWL